MAWPFSRLTTYIALSLPRIKALDVNTIQDYLIHLFAGGKSIKSLWVDGAGDVNSAVSAGKIQASSDIRSGTLFQADGVAATAPAVAPFLTGNLSAKQSTGDMFPIGWGFVYVSGGAIQQVRGVNIDSVVRNSAGNYTITLHYAPPLANFASSVATADGSAGSLVTTATNGTNGGGLLTVIVLTKTTGGVATDSSFSFQVFG